MARALVIVPTYDERENVAEVARRLFDAAGDSVDLLVVDDGSPDGTAALVKTLAAESSHGIHVIERSHKQGLGTAYVTGFKWGLERGYWALVEMDADLSHDPADVPRLLARLEAGADLAIGSRYVDGGGTENWGPLRRALSSGGNLYARMWLGYPVRDSTAGFRAYRAEVLAREDLSTVRSEGYGFQIEMTRRVWKAGGTIAEVPITFTERVQGKSKMSRRIVVEALAQVTRWGLRDLGDRRRVRRGGGGASP
ncbi:MAG TPA: polyprenol monophosphomannose synthase [Actinomycetota bacterium]|nr:polyprenol monophosphomannose synthase [Actinomycetota bacterium]